MRPQSRSDFTVAIICALPIEADAVEALFDETYDRLGKIYGKQPGDANAYINGRIKDHDIVLCYMPGMGIGSAASVASSLRVSYRGVRLALVVGICGGAPYLSSDQNIFLGDVIVSDSVVEYDFGRQYPGGFQRKTDVKDILGRPDREIRTLLAGLNGKKTRMEFQHQMSQHLCMIQRSETQWQHPRYEDILYQASYHHKHYSQDSIGKCCCFDGSNPENICSEALEESCKELGCDEKQVIRRRDGTEAVKVSLHIGKVASANTVMKSGEHRDNIVKAERVIGFEMEGAGVWDNISCIIIKGVCDYADSHKSKNWQAYAAATGASAAKTFLEYWIPTHREERKRHWMVPFIKNPQFVGRQDEIVQLEQWITQQNGPSKVGVCGLGGVGKTQVALELAYRIRERDSECSIFWVPCLSYESVEQAYTRIAQTLGIGDMKPAEAKDQVKAYLSREHAGRWLLIFDNADDINMWIQGSDTHPALKNFLPQNEHGHIVFTTRNRQLAVKIASSYVISIPDQDQDTAMMILQKSLPENYFSDDDSAATILLEHLAFLPLAITQAAAYINANSMRLKAYIDLLQEQEADVVELLSEEFEDEGRYKDIQNPVATTWWISFQQIQHLNTLASDYLSLMACINPRNIPQSFLPQPASKKKLNDAIGLLKAYSFVSAQAEDGLLSVHRLVHLATRGWMRKKNQFTTNILKATDRLNEIFPDSSHGNRKLWQQYLPHSLLVLEEREIQKQQEKYVELRQNIGACLYRDGRYNDAEELHIQVVETRKQVLGPQHPFTLTSMANLASIYRNQGRWKKAEELEIQVIETRKQVLGSQHPSTLTSMANLAATYCNQGRWKKAEELGVQVIETRKQVLGPQHPDTLTSMANLASTYLNQGQWKKAEELEIQVIETSKQVLGPEHPDTLTSMANLASIYRNQGRWKEAEELEIQVIETRKQVLGSQHPDTLTSIANLASTYCNQGRWKKAEELGVQVIETSKQVLGPQHPFTLTSMANLASTYWNQGQWKKAEELEIQVIETRKQVLGPQHPSTMTSMANLASTYCNQGRWKEAEELGVQVIETRKQVLGPQHPDTLTSMANLASIYRNQGRWKEAEELGVQVMETSEQVLGPEHPSTLTGIANLALTYCNQGRWKEAEELGVRVIETRKQVLGPQHPDTLTSMATLASIYRNQGRWKEAEELGVRVIETRKQVLGPRHPSTLTSMANLALIYCNQGRWKKAEELEIQVIETRKQVLGSQHPSTLTSMANLASTYCNQGRWKKAEELGVQVMETSMQVLGPEHPSTLTSMDNLASIYWNQGRLNKAEELGAQVTETRKWESPGKIDDALILMEKCVELRTKIFGPDHPSTLSSSRALNKWLQAKDCSRAKTLLIGGGQDTDQYSLNPLGHHHQTVRSSDHSSVEPATEHFKPSSDSAKHQMWLFFDWIFRRS